LGNGVNEDELATALRREAGRALRLLADLQPIHSASRTAIVSSLVGLCESHARVCYLLAGREPREDTSTHPTRNPP
jgi:hypothetical protein